MDKFLVVVALAILALGLASMVTPHGGEQIGAFIAAIVRGYQEARG